MATKSYHVFLANIIMLAFLSLLLVLFRMKNIELMYELGRINNNINQEKKIFVDLEVRKAEIASIQNLKNYALKFNLRDPEKNQIIYMKEE